MKSLTVPAELEQLQTVQDFIAEELESRDCPMKAQFQIEVAVEEIFVNIAHYAYGGKPGEAAIGLDVIPNPKSCRIVFRDKGVPYNPLEKPDPDITLSAEERQIGGLGIYMVKQSMDKVEYRYEDGCNILTIEKNIDDSPAEE